jgi:hypothetical protein
MDSSRIDDKGYVEQKINEALKHIGDFDSIKRSIKLTLENIENNKGGTTDDEKRLLKQNRSTFKLDIGQKDFFEREKPKYEKLLTHINTNHTDWKEEIEKIEYVLGMFPIIIKYLEDKKKIYEDKYGSQSTSKMGSRSTSKRGGSIIKRLPVKPKAKPVKPKAKPKAKPIKPKAKPIKPKAKPIKPKAKPIKPKAKPIKPKAKPVKPKAK